MSGLTGGEIWLALVGGIVGGAVVMGVVVVGGWCGWGRNALHR